MVSIALPQEDLPQLKDPRQTMVAAHPAYQASIKTNPPPIVAKHAHKASTPINLPPPPATPAHKDFTPTSLEDPRASLVLLGATTTKLHKFLPLLAKVVLPVHIHLLPTHPPASIVLRGRT